MTRDLTAALEQINLLKAQNAQLQALNARHVQQLEQLCEERDAARESLETQTKLKKDLQNALHSWANCRSPIRGSDEITINLRNELFFAYIAARDAVSK